MQGMWKHLFLLHFIQQTGVLIKLLLSVFWWHPDLKT